MTRPVRFAPVATALAAVACLALPHGARAQFQDIDLRGAVDVALATRPEMLAAGARIDAARARRWTDLGVPGPSVSYAREGIGSDPGFTEQRVVLSQEIPMPLGVSARSKALAAGVEAAVVERELLAAQITEAVKTAYLDVLHSRATLALRGRAVELSAALLRAVRTRIEAGEAAELDLLKAQLQDAEARDLLDLAERAYHFARYGLFRSMGLPPDDQRYSVVFVDSLSFVDVPVDQEAVLADLGKQPEVRLADAHARILGHEARGARFAAWPNLFVSWWPQDFGEGYRDRAFEAGLRVPITDWLGGGAARRRADAELRAGDQERESVLLELKKDVEQRWHSYDISRRTIQRYQQSLRGKADDLVRLTREGYLLGEFDLLALLDAQRTFVASEVRYLDALRAYHLDLIRLERYAGRELERFE